MPKSEHFKDISYENIEIRGREGRKIHGLKIGNGSIPCLFVPTGSFQLGRISKNLTENVFTFYVFEDNWTMEKPTFKDKEDYEKFKKDEDEKVKKVDFNGLVERVNEIVDGLKSQFGFSKIALIGFSAPGLIALQAAIKFPKDIALVVCQGVPTEYTDGKFATGKVYFDSFGEPERKKESERDLEKFVKGEEILSDSNFFGKEKKRLTPNSAWTEAAKAFFSRQYYDFKNQQKKYDYAKSWRYAFDGKVINQSMRDHFFDNLLKTLKSEEMQEDSVAKMWDDVAKTNIPIILATGLDYTIRPPQENMKLELNKYKNVRIIEFEKSIHYPSHDEAERFDKEIIAFINENNISEQFEKGNSLRKTM